MPNNYRRRGDRMTISSLTVTTVSAIVDYDDLLDAVVFEGDDSGMGPPWNEHDSWPHELVPADGNADSDADGYLPPGRYWAPGAKEPRYFPTPMMVVVDAEALGIFEDMHKRGASRQTAREGEAHVVSEVARKLVEMHRDGWTWWQCSLQMHGCIAALGGIDSLEGNYADMLRLEMADEVAKELEGHGFTIVNRKMNPKTLAVRFKDRMCYSKAYTPEEWKRMWNVNIHADDNKSKRSWTTAKAYKKKCRMIGRRPARDTQGKIDSILAKPWSKVFGTSP
jgi:hypothetical protein